MTAALLRKAVELHRAGQLGEAESLYREVLATDSDNADALHLLGVAMFQADRHAEAQPLVERAIAVRPEVAAFHVALGNILRGARRFEAARDAFEAALARDPTLAAGYLGLGLIQLDLRRGEAAEMAFRKALLYSPGNRDARNNLGRALLLLGRDDEAVEVFQALIGEDEGHFGARNNLAVALMQAGRLDEAGRVLDYVIEHRPKHVDAHVNRAQLRLLQGDYAGGFAEHDWRLERRDFPKAFTAPRWEGEPLPGKTLLLWAEQGAGDAFQFIRYAAMAAERVGRVVVEAAPDMMGILGGAPGVAMAAERASIRDYAAQAPLMSLPRIFETRLETIPAARSYLPRPAPMALPGAEDALKVGLVWAGSPRHARDLVRSRPLRDFAPLSDVEKVAFHALQKGARAEDSAPDGMALSRLEARLRNWQDTASALVALDLVISVDTAIAHLAGALGVPVWLLVPRVPDWRWGLEGDETRWYPTMRLFREADGWEAVFRELAAALAERVRSGPDACR